MDSCWLEKRRAIKKEELPGIFYTAHMLFVILDVHKRKGEKGFFEREREKRKSCS